MFDLQRCAVQPLTHVCGFALDYALLREHRGLRRIAGLGISVTRGAASEMMFHWSLMLLTVSRHFLTFLRETPLYTVIPFDRALDFHKHVAYMALFWCFVHCGGHCFNFFHIVTQPADDINCLFPEIYHKSDELVSFAWWSFRTVTGFTGWMLVLVVIVLYSFSSGYARANAHSAFRMMHHLVFVLYALMFVHGSFALVQIPSFLWFFIGCVLAVICVLSGR